MRRGRCSSSRPVRLFSGSNISEMDRFENPFGKVTVTETIRQPSKTVAKPLSASGSFRDQPRSRTKRSDIDRLVGYEQKNYPGPDSTSESCCWLAGKCKLCSVVSIQRGTDLHPLSGNIPFQLFPFQAQIARCHVALLTGDHSAAMARLC